MRLLPSTECGMIQRDGSRSLWMAQSIHPVTHEKGFKKLLVKKLKRRIIAVKKQNVSQHGMPLGLHPHSGAMQKTHFKPINTGTTAKPTEEEDAQHCQQRQWREEQRTDETSKRPQTRVFSPLQLLLPVSRLGQKFFFFFLFSDDFYK